MLWKELDGRFIDPSERYLCHAGGGIVAEPGINVLPDVNVIADPALAGGAGAALGAVAPLELLAAPLEALFGDPLGLFSAPLSGVPSIVGPIAQSLGLPATTTMQQLTQDIAAAGFTPDQITGYLTQNLPRLAGIMGEGQPQALGEILGSGLLGQETSAVGAQFAPQLEQAMVASGQVSPGDAAQFLQAFGYTPPPSTAPLAPGDVQVPLPDVNVGAGAPGAAPSGVEAAAPALALASGAPSLLSSLSPIGTAEAAPPLNLPTLASPAGTAGAAGGTGLAAPAATGAAGAVGGASDLVGSVAALNPALAPATAAPAPAPAGVPPAPLTTASQGAAGYGGPPTGPGPVAPPPSATSPAVATTPTAPAASAPPSAPAAPATTPAAGAAGDPSYADVSKAVATDTLENPDQSWWDATKAWLKDNSGLLTAGGLGLAVLSALNNRNLPQQASSATQAANSALGPTGQAFGNALGAQLPAIQAFQTAAGAAVPAATTNLASTITQAEPIIQGQTGLSAEEAAAAAPLINANTTGFLPSGERAALESALAASRAATTSGYANLNQAGSTTEAQDIGAGAARVIGTIPGILQQLVQQGTQLGQASTQAGGEALSGLSAILAAVQGLNQATQTETQAAGGVTNAAGGVTNAAGTNTQAAQVAANANLDFTKEQLAADQELQTALSQLGRNLALSQISPANTTLQIS